MTMISSQLFHIWLHIFILVQLNNAETSIYVSKNIAERRSLIIRCCGKRSCTQGQAPPERTTLPTTIMSTTTVAPPTTTTTQIMTSTMTTTTTTKSTTTLSTTISVIVTTTLRPDTTTKIKITTLSSTVYVPPVSKPCIQCFTGSCISDITNLDNAIRDAPTANLPGLIFPYNIGVKRYHLNKAHYLNFFDAIKFCRQHGMDLATIDSEEEQTAIVNFIEKWNMNSGYIFIAGHKINRCNYTWLNGDEMVYENWAPGEPSQWTGENCAILLLRKWYDLPCAIATDFLCEYP